LFDPRTQAGESNRNQSIDIFNNSWGPEYMRRQPLALAALESGVTEGRKGLGNTYVFAGGNEGNYYGNVNYNSFASSRNAIAVAAIDKQGITPRIVHPEQQFSFQPPPTMALPITHKGLQQQIFWKVSLPMLMILAGLLRRRL
jgi:hypothetical protein